MKGFFKASLIGAVMIALLVAAIALAPVLFPQYNGRDAWAATDNPSSASSGYQVIILTPPAITAATTGYVKFKAPWPFRVLNFSAVAGAIGGTSTLDLKNSAGTSLLSSAMTLSTVVTEATFSTTDLRNITDETTLQIDTANTGTGGPVTLQLDIKRL